MGHAVENRILSFFDEDEEPLRTTSRTRVRRPTPRPRRGRPAGGSSADAQSVVIRRLVALALGVFLLFVLVFSARACNNSRHKDALREYNRQASNIAIESRQTGDELFRALEQGGSQSPQALYAQILSYKGTAENQLKQAQKLKPPSELRSAQESLLLAM